MQGAAITWDLFPILGVAADPRPAFPRRMTIVPAPSRWSSSATKSGSAAIRAIRLSSAAASRSTARPHTVVGVMPPEFSFPENAEGLGPARADRRNRQTRPRAPVHVRPPEAGRRLAQARAELASMRAGAGQAQYPVDQRRLERDGAAALGRVHSRRRAARAVDDDGRGDDRAADRVRERREPDAGARLGPPARVLRPRGARRRPRAVGQAVADRVRRCSASPRRRSASRSRISASGCSIRPCRPARCRTTSTGRSARAASPTRSSSRR